MIAIISVAFNFELVYLSFLLESSMIVQLYYAMKLPELTELFICRITIGLREHSSFLVDTIFIILKLMPSVVEKLWDQEELHWVFELYNLVLVGLECYDWLFRRVGPFWCLMRIPEPI